MAAAHHITMLRPLRTLLRSAAQATPSTSAYPPSAIASSSTTSPLQRANMSTSASAQAQAKARAPTVKRKTTLKKANKPVGPRSTGPRKKAGGGEAASGALTNPFYRQPADMGHLPTLTPEVATQEILDQPMAFGQRDLDTFERCGVEQKIKSSFASHIRPMSVVRASTLSLYDDLAAMASDPKSSPPKHFALTGAESSGKSHLMLQAVSYALASEWLVVYVPRLINWVNSTSPYEYSSEEEAYLQPEIVKKTLNVVQQTNARSGVLRKITVNSTGSDITLHEGHTVKDGSNLEDLLKLASTIGPKAPTPLALQQIFDLFLRSISSAQASVPVLLALDDVQALYSQSKYRDADYKVLQSYELAPVRSLVRFLAGEDNLGIKRGAVLGAVSRSHSEWMPGNEWEAVVGGRALGASASSSSSPSVQSGVETLDKPAQHAYVDIHPGHLASVVSAKWSVRSVPDQWTESELRALYEVRRREGRSWTLPSLSPMAGSMSGSSAGMAMFGASAGGASSQALTTSSEDELFLMRVIDSGRNPHRFDRALQGASML